MSLKGNYEQQKEEQGPKSKGNIWDDQVNQGIVKMTGVPRSTIYANAKDR